VVISQGTGRVFFFCGEGGGEGGVFFVPLRDDSLGVSCSILYLHYLPRRRGNHRLDLEGGEATYSVYFEIANRGPYRRLAKMYFKCVNSSST